MGPSKKLKKPSMLSEEKIVESDEDLRDFPRVAESASKITTSSSERGPIQEQSPDGVPEERGSQAESANGSKRQSPNKSASDASSVSEAEGPNKEGQWKSLADVLSRASPESTSTPAKEYTPPLGFRIAETLSDSNSTIPQLLKKPRGKQIWHITAPASVPITSIQEFAIEDVQNRKSVMSHGEVEYTFQTEKSLVGKQKVLLMPQRKEKAYQRAPLEISQTFHLQQIVKLPGVTEDGGKNRTGGQHQHTASIVMPKPPRSQPEGLKMRYKPFGTYGGPVGRVETNASFDKDSGMVDVEFQMLEGPQSPKEVKRRKHKENREANGSNDLLDEPSIAPKPEGETPRKKPKKKYLASSQETANLPSSPTTPIRVSETLANDVEIFGTDGDREQEQRRDKSHLESAHAMEGGHRGEASEERRIRKEEKRRRRREKEMAKEG